MGPRVLNGNAGETSRVKLPLGVVSRGGLEK